MAMIASSATRGGCGRLAPSPTGAQHLGNARTFLIAFWSARSQRIPLHLRIEDIDSPRVKPWATDQAIEDLTWLGIDWDGEPWIQTEHTADYDAAMRKLVELGRVYPCVCTRRDIESAASAPHEETVGMTHEGPIYPGTCATWRPGDRLPTDRPYCWRFRVRGGVTALDDGVAGRLEMDVAATLGDFPVTRKWSDTGSPTQEVSSVGDFPPAAYQLAVVVDDIRLGVTEVVRGDDLIASAMRQQQIYEAFDQPVPRYAHVPLVRGNDGRRLAKRHGDTRLSHYRGQGVAPESIVRWAARSSGFDAPENAGLSALHPWIVERFDWSRIPKTSVVVGEAF